MLERQMGRAGGAFPPAGAANEAEARDALEAYFADPRLFPLADLQRYVDGVDSAYRPFPVRIMCDAPQRHHQTCNAP